MLDLEHRLIGQNLSHELGIIGHLVIRGSASCHFCQEFAEIVSNRQINKDLLVKTGVIITIDGLNILKFREVTQGVSIAHQILNLTMGFQTFNHVDDVLNLVAMEHANKELIKRVRTLADHVLHLGHQLLLHVHSQELHVKPILALSLEDATTIVGLLHDNLELGHVVVALQTAVDVLLEEALAQSAYLCFWYSVVDVSIQHIANSCLPHCSSLSINKL